MTSSASQPFGVEDSSYIAAGSAGGVAALVNCFYTMMAELPEAAHILGMHPQNLSLSREKLTVFLCGWLGGPREYAERFGPMNIPQVHRHLEIGTAEHDAWLRCMELAIDQQPYTAAFKTYLLQQLRIPAARVYQTSHFPQ